LLKKIIRKRPIVIGVEEELEKLSTPELLEFKELINKRVEGLNYKIDKLAEGSRKLTQKETKVFLEYSKIVGKLESIPAEPDIVHSSGAVAARGYVYYENEHTLDEKEFKVLEGYVTNKRKIKRSIEEIAGLEAEKEYLEKVLHHMDKRLEGKVPKIIRSNIFG